MSGPTVAAPALMGRPLLRPWVSRGPLLLAIVATFSGCLEYRVARWQAPALPPA
jgi:hypothetical protein